jgi:hypothetical protein
MSLKDREVTARKHSSTLANEIVAFLKAKSIDELADYVHRGRSHGRLSSEELVVVWKRAVKDMADAPLSEESRKAESDLVSEFQL